MADWQGVDGKLRREFTFPDFAQALVFVNKVAEAAERMNHHPDIHIHYNKVTMELWTHSAGKVTEKDHKLSKEISRLYKITEGRRG